MTVDLAANTHIPVSERTRQRITWRLMPYLLLLYFFAYVDRTNVSIAALQMKRPLGEGGLAFTDEIIGTGAGIFFLGYFLLEIPGTLIVERWSARKWIARIMISWGIIASLMGFIGTSWLGFASYKNQFYLLRFILGLAEAGFFPGIIVYLSHWFRYEDRARAKSLFTIGIPIATCVGLPISRLIMEKSGSQGWRWVFILEGIPSVILGIITLFYLTDWPQEAKWLPDDEKQWIIGELEKERLAKLSSPKDELWVSVRKAFNRETILLMMIYFFIVTGYYGLTFFIPSITKKMEGTSIKTQTIVAVLPYTLGFIAILINGAHSDRTGERRYHTALPILIGGVAMTFCILSGDSLALVIIFLAIVGIGIHAYLPVFWTWPTRFMAASTAATSIGLINSFGNLGGYVGPKVFGKLSDQYGSYVPGMWFLVICIFIAGLLALLLKNRPPIVSSSAIRTTS